MSPLRKSATLMLALIFMVPIAAASSDAPKAKATTAAPPTAEEYTIGPDDLLAVNVWREPEISRSVLVRQTGESRS